MRARLEAHGLWLGGGRGDGRGRSLPPPSADGLATARGRDSRPVRRPRLASRGDRARDPGSRRSASALPARVGRRAPRLRARCAAACCRRSSPSRASRSSPRSGFASRARGSRSSRPCSSRRAGSCSSTASTGGCTASSSSARSRALSPCSRRCSTVGAGAGLSGSPRRCSWSPPHPYGVLLLGGQAVYVLLEARDRLREAILAGGVVLVCGIPFWLTDLVLADRFDVGVGGGGEKLGGPWAVARYLWRSAGDATAGWWPVTVAVLVAAAAGVVLLTAGGTHARPRAPRRHRRGVRRGQARGIGGARVPAPDLPRPAARDRRRRDARPSGASCPRGHGRVDGRPRRLRARVGLAPDTPALRVGAGRPTGRPGGRRGLARPHEPPRRRPVRLRAALPRGLGAKPLVPDDRRASRRRTSRLADDRARRATRARRLGPRCERAEQHPAATRDRVPHPRAGDGVPSLGCSARSSSCGPSSP